MLCKKPYRQGVAEYGCGKCMPCRIDRRNLWTTRILMEMQSYAEDECLFVTLTYDDEHLPSDGSLRPDDLQLYFKRLRKAIAPARLRYYAVGEYGSKYERPHYHVILFGVRDAKRVGESWKEGLVHVGTVTQQSAAYVAGYVTNFRTGVTDVEKARLRGREPEFARMSLRPYGIGARAMQVLSGVLHGKRGSALVAAAGDVPAVVRFDKSTWPLGRYLRRKLREAVGVPQSAAVAISQMKAFELSVELREEGSRAKREERRMQESLNAEGRERITKTKGVF